MNQIFDWVGFFVYSVCILMHNKPTVITFMCMKLKTLIVIFITAYSINYGYTQQRLTVYLFMAEECPICNYIAKTIRSASIEYKDEVSFIGVFPQQKSHYGSAGKFKKKYGLDLMKIEIDTDQRITKKFDATVTPEVVVTDVDGTILYQGRVNNSYASPGRMRHGKVKEDLLDAIELILSGRPVPKPWPTPLGCYITRI